MLNLLAHSQLMKHLGDKGMTTMFSGDQVYKTSLSIEAIGSVDELNSWLGVCKNKLDDEWKETITNIQRDLSHIQAELAGSSKLIYKRKVLYLDAKIDDIEKNLPETTTFLVPGETEIASYLDVARTVARRAERRVIKAYIASDDIRAYLNRLSTLLYAIERLIIHEA